MSKKNKSFLNNTSFFKNKYFLNITVAFISATVIWGVMFFLLKRAGAYDALMKMQIGFDKNFTIYTISTISINAERLRAFRIANYFDYFFMIAYAYFFYSIIQILIVKTNTQKDCNEIHSTVLKAAAVTAIAAACFDAVENVFLLIMLSSKNIFTYANGSVITLHSVFALLKYIALAFTSAIILFYLLRLLFIRFRKNRG
jgi:hypothetical protein